jgi:hypothetical protein
MKAVEAGKRARRKVAGAGAVSLAVVVVLVLLVSMILGAAPARAQYFTGSNVLPPEPNPYLEGNATIASHYANYSVLQYPSGSGSGTLPARLDSRVANPLLITPNAIVSPGILQNEKVAGTYWNTTTETGAGPVVTSPEWTETYGALDGATTPTLTVTTYDGVPAVTFAWNESSHQSGPVFTAQWAVPGSLLPSANLQFDYVTFGVLVTGPSEATSTLQPWIGNTSLTANAGTSNEFGVYAATGLGSRLGVSSGVTYSASLAGGSAMLYYSASLASLTSTGVNLNSTASRGITFGFIFYGKASTSTTPYTAIVTDVALTTGPLTLGPTYWGGGVKGSVTQPLYIAQANLTAFTPSFVYTSVLGGAYTAAIVQSVNDLPGSAIVTTANPVSVANATSGGPSYVEQVTYNFAFGLPIASGVTYGAFKMMDEPQVAGAQYAVVTVGGTAYTTTYQAYVPQTTYQVVSSVTPTTTTYWIGVVYYTGPQWDSISAPPGLLSSGGIQYLWYELIGIFAAIGGGSGWAVARERSLRNRRAVARAPFSRLVEWLEERKLRRIRGDRRAVSGRHGAIVALGLVTMGAAGITLWAYYDGADTTGLAATFVAGWVLLVAVAVIAFVVYEVVHWARHRRRRGTGQ